MQRPRPSAWGGGAACLWILFCLRWFDAGAAFRPAWLAALPSPLLGLPLLVLASAWLWSGRERGGEGWARWGGPLLVVVLAVLFRLPLVVQGAAGGGVWLAFGRPLVTRYRLSNDGNYVEVLALGTWALVLAARWGLEEEGRPRRALQAGLLLGLAFWCHILAVIHLTAVVLALLVFRRRRAGRSLLALAGGFALGYLPGWLWNAGNAWESFFYLMPGGPSVGGEEAPAGLRQSLAGMVTDHWPILMGYDPGHGSLIDAALLVLAWLAVGLAVLATAPAVAAASPLPSPPLAPPPLLPALNLPPPPL